MSPRPISPAEAELVEWLLDASHLAAASRYREQQVAKLQVTGRCDFGCASLYFGDHKAPFEMLADVVACYPDGQKAGVLLWGSRGEVAWLEVYEMDTNAHHRVPRIEDLRRWEDAGLG